MEVERTMLAEHRVSFRNGHQVMVRGLSLRDLGYARGASVEVACIDDPHQEPWRFTVDNTETSTLSCRYPPPPDWLIPSVRIRIAVKSAPEDRSAVKAAANSPPASTPPTRGLCPPSGEGRAPDVQGAPRPAENLEKRWEAVYALDVGSPKAGLAWACAGAGHPAGPVGGDDLNMLVDAIGADLRVGRSVALGFEAPLFLPVACDPQSLCNARPGEGDRPWSYGAGAYVSTVAIPLAAWVLRALRVRVPGACNLLLDPDQWPTDTKVPPAPCLLLWEAFVSSTGKVTGPNSYGASEHVQDAATAALAFVEWSRRIPRPPSDIGDVTCISIVAAAAMWAGWPVSPAELATPVLVLKPRHPLGQHVRPYSVRLGSTS